MKDVDKCFLKKAPKDYKEITYKELELRRKTIPYYKKKYFLYLHRMLMEVTYEEYVKYHKERERSRYAKKVTEKLSAFSIESLKEPNNNNNFYTKDILYDRDNNVEEIIIRNFELKQLKFALSKLTNEEYDLIKALYFKKMSVNRTAYELNIDRSTVFRWKEQILSTAEEFALNLGVLREIKK